MKSIKKYRKQLRNILFHQGSRPQLAYLHIPKTGGNYITQQEGDSVPVINPVYYLGHTYVVDETSAPNPLYYPKYKELSRNVILLSEIEQYTILVTVRNIFSWLVSYAWHAGGWNPKYRDTEHYDFEIANRGFEYLVKTIANRNETWPNRRFIFCQLFCNNGNLVVDWVNKMETLDDDLSALASANKVIYNKKPKRRVGHKTDYRSYYTDPLIDLVYTTWRRELNLFGYGFEDFNNSKSVLYRAVDETTKRSVRYYWDADKLVVNDEVVAR